jgi:hypothetical protein
MEERERYGGGKRRRKHRQAASSSFKQEYMYGEGRSEGGGEGEGGRMARPGKKIGWSRSRIARYLDSCFEEINEFMWLWTVR